MYAAAASASQHGLPRHHDRARDRDAAASHRLRDAIATNRRSACELGISSMSQNSCTGHDAPLDSVCEQTLRGVAERDSRRKKNLRTSLRKPASRRIGSARRSGNRANRLSAIRKHGCSDRSGKPLDEARRRLHRTDSRLREVLRTPRRTRPRAAIGVRSGSERAAVRDRASP